MSFYGINAAERRYNRGAITASIVYAVTLIGEQYALRYGHLTSAVKYAMAALPALSVIAIFVLVGRYLIEEQDEYLRMRMIRRILWTTGITLAATTLWGFMEDAGLPHLPMFYVAVLWFGMTGCVIRMRDR